MAERCPSCKSFLNESGECEVCGWTAEDGEIAEVIPESAIEEVKKSGGEQTTHSKKGSASASRCPSCKSFLNELGECEVCGWSQEDAVLDPHEGEIRRLMDAYGISRSKAERLHVSSDSEDEELQEDVPEKDSSAVFVVAEKPLVQTVSVTKAEKPVVVIIKAESNVEPEADDGEEEAGVELEEEEYDTDSVVAEVVVGDEYGESEAVVAEVVVGDSGGKIEKGAVVKGDVDGDRSDVYIAEVVEDDETEKEAVDLRKRTINVPRETKSRDTKGGDALKKGKTFAKKSSHAAPAKKNRWWILILLPGIAAYVLALAYAFQTGSNPNIGGMSIVASAFVVVLGVNVAWPGIGVERRGIAMKKQSVSLRSPAPPRKAPSISHVSVVTKMAEQKPKAEAEKTVVSKTQAAEPLVMAPVAGDVSEDFSEWDDVSFEEDAYGGEGVALEAIVVDVGGGVDVEEEVGAEINIDDWEDSLEDLLAQAHAVEAPSTGKEQRGEVAEASGFACPVCHAPVATDANKCSGCGALFEDGDEGGVEFACPVCHAPVAADANKCSGCGAAFED